MTSAAGTERPDPAAIGDAAALARAVAELLSARQDVRAVAADTGLSKTTVAELRARRRRISRDALEKVVRRYDPERLAGWQAAWHRAYGDRDVTTPRELPLDVPGFVGRRGELVALSASTGPVLAITGTAGVGKTALAVHWAYQLQDRYPDGCLYLDLHGYDRDRPVPPLAALSRVLRRVGVDPAGLPSDPEEQAARYRTALAGQRLLLVLDNAHDTEQVRWLLPGSTESLVVVTSRDGLADLRDRYGAYRLELAALDRDDAVDLLAGLVPDGGRDGLAELADRCAGLPLALRVAAGALADRTGLTAAGLAAQLGAAGGASDLDGALGPVFDSSYRYLDDATARTFRRLGGHPGDTVDLAAVAAMDGASVADARVRVDRLVQARLLTQPAAGRYGMHDLLRRYAREQGRSDDPASVAAATDRLVEHYLVRAAEATAVLDSGGPGRASPPSPPPRRGWTPSARPWSGTGRRRCGTVARRPRPGSPSTSGATSTGAGTTRTPSSCTGRSPRSRTAGTGRWRCNGWRSPSRTSGGTPRPGGRPSRRSTCTGSSATGSRRASCWACSARCTPGPRTTSRRCGTCGRSWSSPERPATAYGRPGRCSTPG